MWSSVQGTPRFQSPTFLICFIFVVGYIAVGAHLAWGMRYSAMSEALSNTNTLPLERVAFFREDGTCIIGLTLTGSLLLLSFDMYVIYLGIPAILCLTATRYQSNQCHNDGALLMAFGSISAFKLVPPPSGPTRCYRVGFNLARLLCEYPYFNVFTRSRAWLAMPDELWIRCKSTETTCDTQTNGRTGRGERGSTFLGDIRLKPSAAILSRPGGSTSTAMCSL